MTRESLERNRSAIEVALSRVTGSALVIGLVPATVPAATPTAAAPPATRTQRGSVSDAKAERTRALRGRDPALDSAMEALDLELLE